jgi:hypothetical protein
MSLDPLRRRRWHSVEPPTPSGPVYRDGCYIICEAGEAAAWAICYQGCWGIVYEVSGRQVLSAWVDVEDVPLHVLAEALHGEDR